MPLFTRSLIRRRAVMDKAVTGDNPICALQPFTVSADTNQTITAAAMSGGVYIHSGHTASRTDTTDTAVNIIAANPDMSIGDTAGLLVSSGAAFTIVVAGGTGVTASGNLTVAANSYKLFLLTKTSETTMTLVGL